MPEEKIRIIFTKKAEEALLDILKKYHLEETEEDTLKRLNEGKFSKMTALKRIISNFLKGKTLELDAVNLVQKEITASKQDSEQMFKEIITKLVPMLEKFPEEKFNDPNFREEVSRKIFDEEKPTVVKPLENIKSDNIVTDKAPDKMPEKIPSKVLRGKSRLPQKPPATIGKKPLPKTSVLQAKPRTGPDNYREPIE